MSLSRFSFILCGVFLPSSAIALDALSTSGHAKYQATQNHYTSHSAGAIGANNFTEHDIDLRANIQGQQSALTFAVEVEFLGVGGNGVQTNKLLGETFQTSRALLPNDDRRLFNLTAKSNSEDEFLSVLRLDRLWGEYRNDAGSVRLGRQAVSWGGGLTFSVFDLFNPFSPAAIDKDYKTGDDMAYAQLITGETNDLQALYVPRRNDAESLRADQSSGALFWKTTQTDFEVSLLAGQHYDETLGGIGANYSVLEAIIRADLLFEHSEENNNRTSMVLNADRSWTIFGTNIYGFLEYFHSGFGSDADSYQTPTAEIVARIARGERFTLGKDYISWGVRLEIVPLLELHSLHLVNLHDESGLVQLRLIEDRIGQDVRVQLGVTLPYGKRGSEFGGVNIAPDVFLTPAEQIFVRVSFYL